MNRLKLLATCFAFFCSVLILAGESPYELSIDATGQPCPPSRGRGPFPGSALPGHSMGFPVRLDLVITRGKLDSNGTSLIDFIITNIGAEPIKLPISVNQNISQTQILTLYLTSDATADEHFSNGQLILDFQPTSAELYGQSGDSQTFHLLAPREAMRVHASTRFALRPGTHMLTAHAELLSLSEGTSEVLGTAESITVKNMFSAAGHTAR